MPGGFKDLYFLRILIHRGSVMQEVRGFLVLVSGILIIMILDIFNLNIS
jgi:hypothetical protein